MNLRLKEIQDGFFVVLDPLESEGVCVGVSDADTFETFMMTRLRRTKGDASREVEAYMQAGRSLFDAVADALQSLPANKTRQLRAWIDEARSTRIYAYANIRREHAGGMSIETGLMRTEGSAADDFVASKKINVDIFYIASYVDAADLIDSVGRSPERPRWGSISTTRDGGFEFWATDPRTSFVDIEDEDDYALLLETIEVQINRALQRRWRGAGIYDFGRAVPVYIGTMDAFKASETKKKVTEAITSMLESPTWVKECVALMSV